MYQIYQIYLLIYLFNYFFNLSYQETIYQGYATMYGGSRSGGSCGFKNNGYNNPNYPYGVAINAHQYNNSLSCGSCINIQYNNNGDFGASANFTFNPSTNLYLLLAPTLCSLPVSSTS